MDTNTVLTQAKLRFAHESAKSYLKDKFQSKLLVAEQGGLWKASPQMISILTTFQKQTVAVFIDEFDNPVKVEVQALKDKLLDTYNSVMEEYHTEWKELENQR